MAPIIGLIEGQEWVIVAVALLVMFGGSRLPGLARSLGEARREFQKGLAAAPNDDEDAPPPPAGESSPATQLPTHEEGPVQTSS